ALVIELVGAEAVPYLPALRYKPSGMVKRAQWMKTWELQRREDEFEAEVGDKRAQAGKPVPLQKVIGSEASVMSGESAQVGRPVALSDKDGREEAERLKRERIGEI